MNVDNIRRYEAQTQAERDAIRKLSSYVVRPMLGDVQGATVTFTAAEARGLWDFLVGCNTELSDWRMAATGEEV